MSENQEFEIETLLQKEKYTSCSQLAYARALLSHEIVLHNDRTHVEAAIERRIFGPDELNCLHRFQTALPYPYPFGINNTWKFVYAHTDFEVILWEAYEKKLRVGLYFMTADMLNAGHVLALVKAKEHCDILILMLDTDLITAGMKSKPDDIRPKTALPQRIYMACQSPSVDFVYTVPMIHSPATVVFELVSRAELLQKLHIVQRGMPPFLTMDLIQRFYTEEITWQSYRKRNQLGYYPGLEWQDFVVGFLGSGARFPLGLMNTNFYAHGESLGIPAALQIYYRLMWDNWMNVYPTFSFITVFKPYADSAWASLFEHQASFYYQDERKPEIVPIRSAAPQTSSSWLFDQHQLTSEALAENLRLLEIVKSWEKKVGEEYRFFTDWENPLLEIPTPQFAL